MTQEVNVAIVGAGQAGLSVSYFLKRAGVDHVLFESGRVAETWRSRRWDSFCLVTPNWSWLLPGDEYSGPEPDGFMSVTEIVDHFQNWADSFVPPVREQTEVLSLEAHRAGFKLSLAGGEVLARTVVVATGAYQRPHCPRGAEMIPGAVHQVLAEEYGNPHNLPPGNVLVVGSGQTGCQIAEELNESGRRVYLSCGRAPWVPRKLDGRDIFWWMAQDGWMERRPDTMPSLAARLISNPLTTGHGGGHDLHLRTLHATGVELVGHFIGADPERVYFADDLALSTDFGDARLLEFFKYVERHCQVAGWPAPPFDWPAPLRLATRTELDMESEGITSVVWTSGYRPDYAWVKFPVVDEMGFPIQTDGVSSVPGLYFCGIHWMRKLKSAILYGVGEDAEVVARHITEHRQ